MNEDWLNELASNQVMRENRDRQAFEQWFEDNHGSLAKTFTINARTWEAWQAALRYVRNEEPQRVCHDPMGD